MLDEHTVPDLEPEGGMASLNLSPIEQVELMIANAEADVERHTRNLKGAKALLKAHRATLKIMQDGPRD